MHGVEVDRQPTQIAARFKAKGGISYADYFAVAGAKIHNSPPAEEGVAKGRGGACILLTGDQEFKRLEDEITITWL